MFTANEQFESPKKVKQGIMNRFPFAVCRILMERIRRWVPSRQRTFFAQVAIAAIFACWQGQALFAQNKNVLRSPSEPISLGSPIRSNQPIAIPAILVVGPSFAQNSEANTKNDQVGDGGADDQPAKDESDEKSEFEIADVKDPISLTPFSKLRLPNERLNKLKKSEDAVDANAMFGEMPLVYSPESYFAMTLTPEMQRTLAWKSPDFYHRPLYFEEPNLERYGHYVPLVQSAISAAHFFGRIPSLPYHVGTYPPCQHTYTYGRYRPGSCNPHQLSRPPLSFQGLLLQGVVTSGIVFSLP